VKTNPKGSGDWGKIGSVGDRRGKRVSGVDVAPDRPRNRTERMSLESNGLAKVFDRETKVQARNIDLAMVAQASLRASERPYRDSGSGRMAKFVDYVFVAMTFRRLKSRGSEREAVIRTIRSQSERPHADGSLNRVVNPRTLNTERRSEKGARRRLE